ncbi:MAG: discoidin domain-containing protein, partial [Bacteroidaceae bacterium]
MWGNVKEDMANYVWQLTENEDGTIDMYNVGMEARFNIVDANATLSETGDKLMKFDFAGNENGNTIFYIREASTDRGGNNYLHQWYHNKGTQKEDKPLCLWKGTFDLGEPYETDKGTSEWYLEPVSEEEVQALVEAFAPIKNHDLLVEQNAALRAEVKDAIFKAKDQGKKPLLTSGEQMTSIWSQNRDGNSTDGGNLIDGVLIDGDAGTYWHSIWQNKGNYPELTGDPYIQIADMSELVGEAIIYVKRRATDNGHSVEYTLKGSNDPEAADEDWVTMAVVPLGNASSGQEYTTPVINVGDTPYSNIRVYSTNSSVDYMHAAELQIYVLTDNPNSQFVALGELATNLEKTYLENIAVEDADVTLELYNALKNAYDAFRSGMCDPAEMRAILAKYADTAKGMTEGTNPGQWADTKAFETFDNLYKEAEAYNTAGKYTQAQLDRYALEIPLAAANFMATANAPKANTWYRIKFAPEELYDANGWDKGNASDEAEDTKAPLFGNYLAPGTKQLNEEAGYYDYWTIPTEDVREGTNMCVFDNAELEDEPNASMFRFIEVDAPLSPVNEFQNVMSNARQAIKLAANITVGEPLIKDAKQLSSNASDQAEGKFIEYLLDNNINTFWHSDWHGVATAPHYLQVSFTEPVSGIIEVDMTRRQGAGNGDVLNMYVTASNDGENWDKIGYIYLPFVNVGEQVYSTPVDLNGSYTYLRFTLTQRRGDDKNYDPFGDDRTYFHAAEFQIRPVTVTGASENVIALHNTMRELNKVLVKNLTGADYTTLATA